MLISLNISNIALITSCNLSLKEGLNILSGETGAGKSIIIDSLTFVLGDRADKSLIRSGENTATVEAVFEIELTEGIENCLKELDIEPESTIILKRSMTLEGRNECRVNGKIVTLGMLKRITSYLADIYGQHEHQSLLNTANHIEILDTYGNLLNKREQVKETYDNLNEIKIKLSRFGSEEEIRRKLDTLQYQIDEITGADVKDGEEAELLAERARFMSAEKIIGGVSGAYNCLNGSDKSISCETSMNTAKNLLSSVIQYDDKISNLYERLESVTIELSDITSSLNDYVNGFDYDERKADLVEKRIDEIKLLRRKYGNNLNDFLTKAQEEYELLSNSNDIIEKLNKEYNKTEDNLLSLCLELSNLRKIAAKKFENEIIGELNDLGMNGTTFAVSIIPDSKNVSVSGYDEVEFLISPNRGEPLKPLSKIISGGEMSRFMLALKNITAKGDKIDCMVFDEIDTGISGHIAQVVAEKLCNISRDRQVIAVTHLPQLASMADNHYLIEKSYKENKTITILTLLDDKSSTREIARLIGGSDYSGYAVPHAEEMKNHSRQYKLTIIG